jgi:hypothetical protein
VAFSYQGSDFVRPISSPAQTTQQQTAAGSRGTSGAGSGTGGSSDALRRQLRLSEQEMAMYLDLGPYANPSYYVVQARPSV